MAGIYVDTSALGRILLGEPDAAAILQALGAYEERAASRALAVELRRLAARRALAVEADRLLGGIALVPVDEAILADAETIAPASIATLDAIHLATAVRLAKGGFVEAVITYDAQLAAGAQMHALEVIAPA